MLRKKKTIILVTFIIGLLLALSWTIYYVASHATTAKPSESATSPSTQSQDGQPTQSSLVQQLNDNNQAVIALVEEKLSAEILALRNKPITVAILGSDARSTETSRSDVIMLVKFNPLTNKALVISVPRDSRVSIPGVKIDKINHAFAFGGPELSVATLEALFDTTIDYYIKFTFDDFQLIIDQLGGVDVTAAKDYGYTDTIVPEGPQTLGGEKALFYVRFRYDKDGDFGRIKRQQEVIGALSKELYDMAPETLRPILTDIYTNNVEANIELTSLLDYYKAFDHTLPVTIDSHTLKNTGAMIDKVYYGIVDEADLTNLKALLND